MSFSVRKVHPDAIIPRKKLEKDAGFDLFALSETVIQPWSQVIVDTGVELVELPYSYINDLWSTGLFIWPRSGLDAKFALTTGAGVVDYLYRGRILVLLKNESYVEVIIPYGSAIAQAIIHPVWAGGVEVVTESKDTERGASGGITSVYADRTES
jgi:dUTP pyrophosphatase